MKCDVRFDYVHPHNGERWFRCVTCGHTDWFGRGHTPKTLDRCVLQTVENLDAPTRKLIEQAYCRGYQDAATELRGRVPKQVDIVHALRNV
jgi:hypothetical protein